MVYLHIYRTLIILSIDGLHFLARSTTARRQLSTT